MLSALMAGTAHAATAFDPRSVGMGGIGVSTADHLTAPFHNPALAARHAEDVSVGFVLPSFGVFLQDKDDMIQAVTDISDSISNLDNNNTLANANSVVSDLQELRGSIGFIEAGAGLSLFIPTDFINISPFVKAQLDVMVLADIDQNDLIAANLTNPAHQYGSIASASGVLVVDYGVALSKAIEFDSGTLYVGMSPKVQQIETINYAVGIESFDDGFEIGDYMKAHMGFNVDLGVAYEIEQGFTFGLAATNLIPQSYTTNRVLGLTAEYLIHPVFTASVSYVYEGFTIGVDVDINETQRFTRIVERNGSVNDKDDNVQMGSIGAEYAFTDWASIRAGYELDLRNNLKSQFSAGLGLKLFDTVGIDVAGAIGAGNTYGASLQLHVTF